MSTELLRDPAIERNDSVWAYVSPSRLNLWLRCPLAFKFRYIDGIRTPTTTSLFVGKMVHAGLEHFYRHRQTGIQLVAADIVEHLDTTWTAFVVEEEMQFESSEEEAELKHQAQELVTVYLRQLPASEKPPAYVEETLTYALIDPFTGEDFGIPLLGIVDLILPGTAGVTICDFKTASKSNTPVEILHEVQLTSYAYLYRQHAGIPESSLEIRSLIKTKKPKIECHRYLARREAHFRRFFQIVRAYLDDLHSQRFIYRPGWTCSMCDFRDGPCQRWLSE